MTIELFHLWECPLSNRVREFVERNQLRTRVRYVDVDDELGAEDRLFDLTGLAQVPCLIVDESPIRGTANIIGWLKGNLLAPSASPEKSAPSPA